MSKQVHEQYHAAIDMLASEVRGSFRTTKFPGEEAYTVLRIEPHCSPAAPRSELDGLLARVTTYVGRRAVFDMAANSVHTRDEFEEHTMFKTLTAHPSVLTLACLLVLCPERCLPEWSELVEVEG